MKKPSRVGSVLSDAESQQQIGVTEKQANQIMALLDEWIDRCESKHRWIVDESNRAPAEHQRMAEMLQESIAKVKTYREAIQSDGQAFWALAMLHVTRAASLMVTLDRDLEWFVNHNTLAPTLKKQLIIEERRQWLSNRIQERPGTADEIEGSRSVRRTLFEVYEIKFQKKYRTFTTDLKSLGYNPR